MNLWTLVLFAVSVVFCTVHNSEATRCVPFSNFKVDCNDCQCSENGIEYSCIPGTCFNEDNSDNSVPGQVYPREAVEDEVVPPYPYINDEIPSSQERVERDYIVVDPNESNADSPSNEYKRDAEEVSNEAGDVAYIIPQDYRRRRQIGYYD